LQFGVEVFGFFEERRWVSKRPYSNTPEPLFSHPGNPRISLPLIAQCAMPLTDVFRYSVNDAPQASPFAICTQQLRRA